MAVAEGLRVNQCVGWGGEGERESVGEMGSGLFAPQALQSMEAMMESTTRKEMENFMIFSFSDNFTTCQASYPCDPT
ncbi:hypothetical protein [Bellilinea caldifistulae]|uniref:hypothetical protein n=1 Tax=Bellilinea caldifistulae TaxID=360411 RepID=UPI0011AEBBD1|nr:hypothetical protein [Bellilinea caldifistulae]